MHPRARRWTALGLALLVLAPFAPIALGRSFYLRDILRFTYPLKALVRARWLAGEVPLWNPLMGLGRPLLGLVQPGVYYPPGALALLPAPHGLDLFSVLHAVIAALGMRAWLRALFAWEGRRDEVHEVAALVGGLLFALSGYFVSVLAGSGPYAWGVAWVPWVLAFATPRDDGAPVPRRVALAGGALALAFLAGDPQAVFFALGVGGVLLLGRRTRREAGAGLGLLAAAALLFAALAAVEWLPALDVARFGRPGGVPFDEARHFALSPVRLVELLWPGAFGTPHTPGWFVHALVDEGTGRAYEPWAAGIYLGLLAPLLAAFALAGRRRTDLALGGLLLLSLLLAFGAATPLFGLFFRLVPGAKLFRYPEKYFLVTTLCLAALAARGLPAAVARPRRLFAAAVALLVVLGAGLVAARVGGGGLAARLVGRLGAVPPAAAGASLLGAAGRALLVGAALALVATVALGGRLAGRRLAGALFLVGAVDLILAALPLARLAPASLYTDPSPVLDALPAPAAGAPPLRLYRPTLLDLTRPGAEALLTRWTLTPNCGWERGIDHLDAYDVFRTDGERLLWSALRDRPLRLLQVAATPHALLGHGQLGRVHPGLVVRRDFPQLGAALVDVEDAAPRAYLATDARPVATAEAAAALTAAADFAPGKTAAIEGGVAARAEGACQLTAWAAEEVHLACSSSEPSYAVLADAFFPGWEATVDGSEAPVLRANAAFRAAPVPAGRSTVIFRYRPPRARPGAALSLLGLLAFAALLLLRRRTSPVLDRGAGEGA